VSRYGYNAGRRDEEFLEGGLMRRLLLVSVTVSLAAASALLVSLFAFSENSLASDTPSQGTSTQGATAGPNEPSLVDGTGPGDSVRGDALVTATKHPSPRSIVRVARWHIGTPYRNSPPGTCRAYRSEDCSCTTKLVFKKFGMKLPEDPVAQWNRGFKVRGKTNLRRGDLVFFKEAGRNRPITHVGIYSGHGNLIHASNFFGKVVESKMKYMRGYIGAKRIR
jgi:cell wall-associated NlpC family hydrolase